MDLEILDLLSRALGELLNHRCDHACDDECGCSVGEAKSLLRASLVPSSRRPREAAMSYEQRAREYLERKGVDVWVRQELPDLAAFAESIAAEERAAVVAWLRSDHASACCKDSYADAIERGEHRT